MICYVWGAFVDARTPLTCTLVHWIQHRLLVMKIIAAVTFQLIWGTIAHYLEASITAFNLGNKSGIETCHVVGQNVLRHVKPLASPSIFFVLFQ